MFIHCKINFSQFKLLIIFFCFLIFICSFLINLNSYFMDFPWWSVIHERNINKNINKIKKCINQDISFKKSLELQKEGMPIIKLINGRINLKATWELIPRHFNNIWINEFNKMEIFRLQSDEEEQKYFIKFLTNLKRPFNCNIITLGVGHSIWAERNLSKIYPECHFIGVDPASDINSDLIKNELGGKFIKAAVGGETLKKILINVWEKDVKLKGVNRRIVPQIGIIDFLKINYQKKEPIDLLLIDIEGAEFGILEKLSEHSKQFPVPICQLNIEIHHPNELNKNYTYERFFNFFDRFIRFGKFALLHTDIHKDKRYMFLRLFLVNIKDNNCIQKFIC